MPAASTVSEVALVIIAIALSIHSLMLIAGTWLVIRGVKEMRAHLDRRLEVLEARVDGVLSAATRMTDTVDRCASQVSTILHHGERLTGAVVTAVVTPKALLAGAASKLITGWRRRRRAA
jgi:uncharacterized protein YoxC